MPAGIDKLCPSKKLPYPLLLSLHEESRPSGIDLPLEVLSVVGAADISGVAVESLNDFHSPEVSSDGKNFS